MRRQRTQRNHTICALIKRNAKSLSPTRVHSLQMRPHQTRTVAPWWPHRKSSLSTICSPVTMPKMTSVRRHYPKSYRLCWRAPMAACWRSAILVQVSVVYISSPIKLIIFAAVCAHVLSNDQRWKITAMNIEVRPEWLMYSGACVPRAHRH